MELRKINRAYEYLIKRIKTVPDTIIILGSGLGGILDDVVVENTFDYASIPCIKSSTTPFHDGKLIFGSLSGHNVAVMKGRIHLYEDNTPCDVVRLIRVLSKMGAKNIILTNSAGGINTDYEIGDIVQIVDHVSLFVPSPLTGNIRREIGTKLDFVDMTKAYDPYLIELSKKVSEENGIKLKQGVYVQLKGAQYETPAEIKILSKLGVDLVGMSTVIEVLASRHMGMRVCAFSTVTNMASGIMDVELSHEDVKIEANKAGEKLTIIIKNLLRRLD